MRNQDGLPALGDTDGFTLVEVIVALAVTLIMIGSVFGLMVGGQTTFRRETQVANMQMSTRAGLQLLSRDLTMVGYRTPPASAIIWADSGGLQPDEITIVYADPRRGVVATASMRRCWRALRHHRPVRDSIARSRGRGPHFGDGRERLCRRYGAGGHRARRLQRRRRGRAVALSRYAAAVDDDGRRLPGSKHQPQSGLVGLRSQQAGRVQWPSQRRLAIVGRFRLISYRVSPPPPTLERRDLTVSGDWIPVAHNI